MKAVFATTVLLATLATSAASAQGVNLSGPWQCIAHCLGPPGSVALITQNGWELNIDNTVGTPSRAWVDYPGRIWVQRTQQGAIYTPDGGQIQFDDGTVWMRAAP